MVFWSCCCRGVCQSASSGNDGVAVLQRLLGALCLWAARPFCSVCVWWQLLCRLGLVDGVSARGLTHCCCAGVASQLWLVWSHGVVCAEGAAMVDFVVSVSRCVIGWVAAPSRRALCVVFIHPLSWDQVVRLLTGLRLSWISATALRPYSHLTTTAAPAVVVTDKRARASAS